MPTPLCLHPLLSSIPTFLPPPQRDVELEVEGVDKGGTFLGTLRVPGQKGLNLGGEHSRNTRPPRPPTHPYPRP